MSQRITVAQLVDVTAHVALVFAVAVFSDRAVRLLVALLR